MLHTYLILYCYTALSFYTTVILWIQCFVNYPCSLLYWITETQLQKHAIIILIMHIFSVHRLLMQSILIGIAVCMSVSVKHSFSTSTLGASGGAAVFEGSHRKNFFRLYVQITNRQFLTWSQHIITKFSSQVSTLHSPKISFGGQCGMEQTSDGVGRAPLASLRTAPFVCASVRSYDSIKKHISQVY